MRYVCVHCEHRWEADGEHPPARCPSCMRATGLEKVHDDGPAVKARTTRPKHVVGVALLALLAAIGGYFVWGRRPTAGDPGSVGPMTAAELHASLATARVSAGDLEAMLVPDGAVERFAKATAGTAVSPYAKAEAITAALRARAKADAFVPWSLAELRSTPLSTPSKLLALLEKDGARLEAYPLELASLAVASLRAVAVPAMLAELQRVDGERAPLDPSGYLGYFVVAVWAGDAGVGTPRLFDPYGGRALREGARHVPLADGQSVGAALALRALHDNAYGADPKTALERSSQALVLAGTLPSVRTVRGLVVLGGRLMEQGLQELSAARQLRGDAPRLHNLATAELVMGDFARADKDLTAALAESPDFASAHATRAGLALARGELDPAKAELAEAVRLAPDLSLVKWMQAELLLRTGARAEGVALAQEAVAQRPSFDNRLRLAMLLHQLSRYDDLRRVASELVAMAPEYRKGEVRDLLRGTLGPTALEDVDAEPDASEVEGAADDGGLELGEPTLEVPGGSGVKGPSLRDPAQREPSGPRVRLRGAGDELRIGR